jgi:acetylornithine deacetylase/succinyl-diaminopimelate desuccinylase
MSFDRLGFHERAVRTPSHESVEEMRALLVDTLREAGADPTVDEAGNTLATRTADGHDDPAVLQDDATESVAGPHVVLNTHVDTVPPHVPVAEREGGALLEGRGACDAKGPLAALVDAFLRADVDAGRVTLAVTPDEEVSQTGGAHLAGALDADGVVVGEPTGLDVCPAARGQFEGAVTVQGTSAHAATPGEGDNAVRALAPLLQAMETYDGGEARTGQGAASGDRRDARARGPGEHESLGRPTLTPTLVSGGTVPNQVPAEASVTFDRRSVPPESAPEFRAALEDHLSAWVPDSMGVRVDLEEREAPYLEAFATDEDETLVRTLARASGGAVRPFGAATEASFFAAHAPTVVFGPGVLADDQGAVAHSDREYVRRADVELAADAVRETVDELL